MEHCITGILTFSCKNNLCDLLTALLIISKFLKTLSRVLEYLTEKKTKFKELLFLIKQFQDNPSIKLRQQML